MHNHLFSPIKIANLEIKNRIVMAPMGIIGLADEMGGFSKRAEEYYVARAKGGVGLIITGLAKIDNDIEELSPGLLCVTQYPMHFVKTAGEMVERVHAYGTKIFLQLTVGFGRVASPKRLMGQPVAPSPIPYFWDPSIICRELSILEIHHLIEKAAESANIAKMAGFDGVEIHAVHEGYLLDQFSIAMFNKRNDKYGGDLIDRLAFAIEIVKTIKQATTQDFPVFLRYSIKSYIKNWNKGGLLDENFEEKGRDIEEGLLAAQILEKGGYDGFNADAGSYEAWYWAHPPTYQKHGTYLHLTKQLKKVINAPVLVAGRMELPHLANKTLKNGNEADMIALGRGLLADPEWTNKVAKGDFDDIRPCLGCHNGCLGRSFTISCAVNPVCGRESEYAITPTPKSKSVLIVGAGVAGMEAARIATLRGHKACLYEKTNDLGGNLTVYISDKHKEDHLRLLEWYKAQIQKLDINVFMNTLVDEKLLIEKNPDVIIIATGSILSIPDIPGIDKSHVLKINETIISENIVGKNIVTIGGGLVGCEVSLNLSRQSRNITIVDTLPDLMMGGLAVPHANRMMITDLLRYHDINILTNTSILEIHDDKVDLINGLFQKNTLDTDTIIIATGMKPVQELYCLIRKTRPDTYLIGDANSPRNIMAAIWEAYEVGRSI